MHRIILMAAVGAMLAFGGTASAGHKTNHSPNANSAKCTSNKAFVVKGVLSEGQTAVTDASTEVMVDIKRANRHAKRNGFERGDTNVPFALTGGKTVKVTGGDDSAEAGDKVRVVGKVAWDRCGERRDGDGRGYEGDPVIRKIKVNDRD